MGQGCASWRLDLGAYVIGALDRQEREAMSAHLAVCPACRAEYEELLPVRDWLVRVRRHLAACQACRAVYGGLLHARLT